MVSSREQVREEWLKCRTRLREATTAVLPTVLLWPEGSHIPSSILGHVNNIQKGHLDAADAFLRSTLALQDVETLEDIMGFPTLEPDLKPTKENIVRLALTLEHNESYFKLLQGAIEILLTCMAEERQFLQDRMEDSLNDKGDAISKES